MVLGFALYASLNTVTNQSRQFKFTPEFISLLTDMNTENISWSLQGKTDDLRRDKSNNFFAEYDDDDDDDDFVFGPKPPIKPNTRHEDLVALTRPQEDVKCPQNMYPVEIISNPEADAGVGRRIPKIVHMTGKTKCLTDFFLDAARKWQFEDHSFYFHDDQAVEDLFNQDWPMFPQLKNALLCLDGAGGGKARSVVTALDEFNRFSSVPLTVPYLQ